MVKFLQLIILLIKFGLLSLISKENQKKQTKVNFNSNRILNSLIPALPISYSILFLILVFSNTSVYCQKKEQARPTNENAIKLQELSTEAVHTKKNSEESAVSTSPNQIGSIKNNNSVPSNFDNNSISADVRQKLEDNKKYGRPFFEGISMALEFELMNAKVSESELIVRIEKNKDAQIPIHIKKRGENLYWIITDTNTSTSSIKEMVSAAGLTVNFISKSYLLK